MATPNFNKRSNRESFLTDNLSMQRNVLLNGFSLIANDDNDIPLLVQGNGSIRFGGTVRPKGDSNLIIAGGLSSKKTIKPPNNTENNENGHVIVLGGDSNKKRSGSNLFLWGGRGFDFQREIPSGNTSDIVVRDGGDVTIQGGNTSNGVPGNVNIYESSQENFEEKNEPIFGKINIGKTNNSLVNLLSDIKFQKDEVIIGFNDDDNNNNNNNNNNNFYNNNKHDSFKNYILFTIDNGVLLDKEYDVSSMPDNSLVTKKYVDDEIQELKNYVDDEIQNVKSMIN